MLMSYYSNIFHFNILQMNNKYHSIMFLMDISMPDCVRSILFPHYMTGCNGIYLLIYEYPYDNYRIKLSDSISFHSNIICILIHSKTAHGYTDIEIKSYQNITLSDSLILSNI